MESLRTALDIKKAIELVPNKIKSMGPVSLHEFWRTEEDCYGGEDPDKYNKCLTTEDKNYLIHQSLLKIDTAFHNSQRSFHRGGIPHKVWSGTKLHVFTECAPDFVKTLYELGQNRGSCVEGLMGYAEQAPFGDVQKQLTIIDENVRQAYEIRSSNFKLKGPLLGEIKKVWSRNFYPKQVKVVPYKINIYPCGNGFNEHRDTPDKNLVGTFLIGLIDRGDGYHGFGTGSKLIVTTGDKKQEWVSSNGGWCAFYPDCPHEVTPIKSGIRATMAFKIYATDNYNKTDFIGRPMVNSQLNSMKKIIQQTKKFGILLSHDYSVNSTQLKGTDQLWYQLLKRFNLKLKIIPVLVTLHRSLHNDIHNIKIYPFTQMQIDHVLGKHDMKWNKKMLEQYRSHEDYEYYQRRVENYNLEHSESCICQWPYIEEFPLREYIGYQCFYSTTSEGYQWSQKLVEYAEKAGNECRPDEEDSIYLHRAILIDTTECTNEFKTCDSKTTSTLGEASGTTYLSVLMKNI